MFAVALVSFSSTLRIEDIHRHWSFLKVSIPKMLTVDVLFVGLVVAIEMVELPLLAEVKVVPGAELLAVAGATFCGSLKSEWAAETPLFLLTKSLMCWRISSMLSFWAAGTVAKRKSSHNLE